MLDIECFSFLNRALENELAPLVIMASNRGVARIRGTNLHSPHGLPPDLLDRVLIVSTQPYTPEDIQHIIKIRYVHKTRPLSSVCSLTSLVEYRCEEEDVTLTDSALEILTGLASDTTLRYVLNLISCAQMLARKRKSEAVEDVDIRRAYTYFFDEKRSLQWIKEQHDTLVTEEGIDFAVGGVPFGGKAKATEDAMDES